MQLRVSPLAPGLARLAATGDRFAQEFETVIDLLLPFFFELDQFWRIAPKPVFNCHAGFVAVHTVQDGEIDHEIEEPEGVKPQYQQGVKPLFFLCRPPTPGPVIDPARQRFRFIFLRHR